MTTEFKIMFVDECGDQTCYFYDEHKNQYYDNTYFGDYAEGDVVRVSWNCFDGINREVSSVEKHAQTNDVYSNIERRIDGSYVVEKWTKLYESAFELDKQTDWYFRFAEIVDMLKMKMTESEIGEELGIDHAAVHKRIMKIVKAIGAK